MAIRFQQKCIRCKNNYVLVSKRQRFPVCYDCQKSELNVKIEDPEMKKMFDIPEELYKENSFLRDIKSQYIKYKSLTEKQIEAFKKTVSEMSKK